MLAVREITSAGCWGSEAQQPVLAQADRGGRLLFQDAQMAGTAVPPLAGAGQCLWHQSQ